MLGTDSTSTIPFVYQEPHYHDHEQKLFEVGRPGSTVALATWGLGRLGEISHRTLAARLGKAHENTPFATMKDMAEHLAKALWTQMETAFGPEIKRLHDLRDKSQPGDPNSLTPDEWEELDAGYQTFRVGYFLAGRVTDADNCEAYEIDYNVLKRALGPEQIAPETPAFRGVPIIMERLVLGHDTHLAMRVLSSGKWTGSPKDLWDVLRASDYCVRPHLLPLRDAIDWIHTVIHTTIRANKFSGNHHCGGPVELAVVTTDRPFRWVCHKPLDAAIITAQERPWLPR